MTEEAGGYVYAAPNPLALEAVVALLTQVFPGSTPAVLRSVANCEFRRVAAPDLADTVAGWPEGQIFNAHYEARWKRQNENGYALLLLTEAAESVPAALKTLSETPFLLRQATAAQEHGLLLWGTKIVESASTPVPAGEARAKAVPMAQWREARIPRLLSYPAAPAKQPPRIAYHLYLEPFSEAVQWVRLVEII